MHNYTVRIGEQEPITVRVHPPSKPLSTKDDLLEAARYVAASVEQALAPLIRSRPASKDVERDAAGQITRVIETPADEPATATARRAGLRVARQFIDDVRRGTS